MKPKIAIVTDSTCDLSPELIQAHDIRIMPLQVIYQGQSFRDGVEITPQEVYDGFEKEIPKTSLPLPVDIQKVFDQLKAEGIEQALVITISSGLSGTFNLVHSLVKDYQEEMQIELIDSKTLSYAEGFAVLEAAKERERGGTLQSMAEKARHSLANTELMFVIPTLQYLKAGGRIGRVEGTIGDLLNLKPIISVEKIHAGIYYTVMKARGRKKSLTAIYNLAADLIERARHPHLAVLHGGALEECREIMENLKARFGDIPIVYGQISPALGVHTGTGLIGICIQSMEGLPPLQPQ